MMNSWILLQLRLFVLEESKTPADFQDNFPHFLILEK